ncbi:hypothetical protein PR002_g11152 [Phytophthora rubi]|uniref:Secreted protein n=1 Tax=Phytophthora rubi TaxID=129364 RepID=A0A6A3M609_9STRA|nr:hypothetical protein PR002_g11152 [Phytophthora rubi]
MFLGLTTSWRTLVLVPGPLLALCIQLGLTSRVGDTGSDPRALYQSLVVLGSVLRQSALAETTMLKYRAHWRQWVQFSCVMKWSPWLDGTSAECDAKLSSFAVFCWRCGWNGKGNQYDTSSIQVFSIRWYHHAYRGVTLATPPPPIRHSATWYSPTLGSRAQEDACYAVISPTTFSAPRHLSAPSSSFVCVGGSY